MTIEFTHFAMIQYGHAILGVGDTVNAARRDAEEWTDGIGHDVNVRIIPGFDREMIIGNYYVVPCTKALADECVQNGSPRHWHHDINGLTAEYEEAI